MKGSCELRLVFRPGRGGFPDTDADEAHAGAQRIARSGVCGVSFEPRGNFIKESFGKDFGGGFGVLEGDDAFAIGGAEGGKVGILGVHAQSVVKLGEKIRRRFLDGFEVTDHAGVIKGLGFEDDLDAAAVPVREPAQVGVFGQDVSIFNFKGLADSERHSGSPGIAKKVDVETVAKSVAGFKAKIQNHPASGDERLRVHALRHEQDLPGRNRRQFPGHQSSHLFQVGFIANHKLQLVIVIHHPLPQYLGTESVTLMAGSPRITDRSGRGRRVRELRADRGQVADDIFRWEGSCGFDGDVVARFVQCHRQFPNLFGDERLAAGYHAMTAPHSFRPLKDFRDGKIFPLGLPGGVGSVAPRTAQVAARRPDEHRRNARQTALALNRVKNLGDQHGEEGLAR